MGLGFLYPPVPESEGPGATGSIPGPPAAADVGPIRLRSGQDRGHPAIAYCLPPLRRKKRKNTGHGAFIFGPARVHSGNDLLRRLMMLLMTGGL